MRHRKSTGTRVMFYRCCPLGIWNVDWSTGTIWSTGTPFFVCSVCFDIFASADWFVLIFPSVCFLQGARVLLTFGGRFTDPELSRFFTLTLLRC